MPELTGLPLFTDSSLQEYYKLEDLTGKNGNTLTNNGTATFVAAKFGNGADFGSSANDRYLTQTSALGFNGGAYSVSLWVNVNTAVAAETIYNLLNIGDATTDTEFLLSYSQLSGVKAVYFSRIRRGVGADEFTHTIDLGTATWHHIAQTYDGTTVRGYVNGTDVGNIASSGSGTSGTSGLIINGQLNSPTTSNGLQIIDDVALFNKGLSFAEVQSINYGKFPGAMI